MKHALLLLSVFVLTLLLCGSAAAEEQPMITLNSGYPMPVIGLGTWTLSDEQAEASVYAALKTGMRLIDTARYYGNEIGVGRGIRRAIDDGIVTREEIFVTSKIMPGDYNRAAEGINNSLRDLGLDYVDLMLIHQPGWNDEAVYRAMEQAVRDGKVRSIGISNYYTPEAVEEILSFAEIMPAVIQNENHLYYQNKALQEYVQQYGIVVESWYPLAAEATRRSISPMKLLSESRVNTEKRLRKSSCAGRSRTDTLPFPAHPIRSILQKTTMYLISN